MPSVAKVLREEIARVSRLQLRRVGASLRKSDAAIRRAQADLARRIARIETTLKLLARKEYGEQSPQNAVLGERQGLRVTGKMVRSLRRRLGVSQENLAKLLNITAQSVYLWERKSGKLRLRSATARGLAAARKMTKKDVQEQLSKMTSSGNGRAKRPAPGRR